MIEWPVRKPCKHLSSGDIVLITIDGNMKLCLVLTLFRGAVVAASKSGKRMQVRKPSTVQLTCHQTACARMVECKPVSSAQFDLWRANSMSWTVAPLNFDNF